MNRGYNTNRNAKTDLNQNESKTKDPLPSTFLYKEKLFTLE